MSELDNTSEMTTQAAAPETGTPNANAGTPNLDEFRRVLAGEPGENPNPGEAGESQQNATPTEGEPQGEKPKGKPKSLKDLAETLNLEDKDLYGIEVPLGGDGKTVTLGELKDAFSKQDDLSVRELELEERRAKFEADVTQERADLEALIKLIDPKAITPQFVQEVKQRAADEAKREMAATLELIPEWKDAGVREKELAGMIDYMKGFGIPPSFLTAVPSHKMFRLVRDAWQRKTRVDAALAKMTPVKRDTTAGKSKPTGSAPRKPNASKASLNTGDMRSRFVSILQAEG